MRNFKWIRRPHHAGLIIVCLSFIAGCTNTTGSQNTAENSALVKGRKSVNVTVSTYAPPNRSETKKTRPSWPRLVDSRRGLWAKHAKVKVKCLKPELVALLKKIERKFGKPPVITSGYRSPAHNRRVRGARRSKHMSCEAADISIAGVSKWTLAKYVRSLPGRGGVGTYCRSSFVHVDVASKRDWNWGCRKRRKRRT